MPGNEFDTTYGDAVKNGDFSTCRGTMDVSVELHPSEYVNFEGFSPVILTSKSGKKYLAEPCGYGGESVIRNGQPQWIENY